MLARWCSQPGLHTKHAEQRLLPPCFRLYASEERLLNVNKISNRLRQVGKWRNRELKFAL